MSFLRKCSQQFWGSHNLYITTTLKHDLFSLLVCKDFWKEKTFCLNFLRVSNFFKLIFGKSFPPEIFVLASPARSFLTRLEGVLTFHWFLLYHIWLGEELAGRVTLGVLLPVETKPPGLYPVLFLRPSPTALPLLPLCLQIWVFFWKLGRGWETRTKEIQARFKGQGVLNVYRMTKSENEKGKPGQSVPQSQILDSKGARDKWGRWRPRR